MVITVYNMRSHATLSALKGEQDKKSAISQMRKSRQERDTKIKNLMTGKDRSTALTPGPRTFPMHHAICISKRKYPGT